MKEIKGEQPPPMPDKQPPTNKEEALNNILTVTETLDKNMKAGKRINEVNRLMSESKNIFEKTFGESITKLFDKKDGNLKMIARLNNELTYYIVKHLLVLNWYATFWNKLSVNFTIIQTKKYPFWEVHREYIGDSLLIEKYDNAYRDTIDDLLMLTISQGGLGRTELLQAISAAEEKMREGQLFGGRVGQALQKFGLS
jgi:hypothetical protein